MLMLFIVMGLGHAPTSNGWLSLWWFPLCLIRPSCTSLAANQCTLNWHIIHFVSKAFINLWIRVAYFVDLVSALSMKQPGLVVSPVLPLELQKFDAECFITSKSCSLTLKFITHQVMLLICYAWNRNMASPRNFAILHPWQPLPLPCMFPPSIHLKDLTWRLIS